MEHASEAERIARTESLFREVNERIADAARRARTDAADFVCECAEPDCTQRIHATIAEYEEVRADGATFMLRPGHDDGRVETVVERDDGHAVVQKRHPEVEPLVRRLNPRAA